MTRHDHDNPQILPDGPAREGLLVLGLAEVAAPEDSLVWSLLGAAERQLRYRDERAPAGGLMTLKLRSWTPRLAPLVRQARHTVLLQGFQRTGGSTPSILHQRLTAAGGVWRPVLSMPRGAQDPHTHSDLWTLAQERVRSSAEPGPSTEPVLWHREFDPLTNLRAADGEPDTGRIVDASGARQRSPESEPGGRPQAAPRDATPPSAQEWPGWLAEASGPGGVDQCRIALPAKGDLAWVFPEMGVWFPEVVLRLTGILWDISHDRPVGGAGTLDAGHVA